MPRYDEETLQAREDIRECLNDYCRGLDNRAWDSFHRVFHDDAVCVLSAIGGPWRDWLAQARELLTSATEVTHHQIGNILFAIDGARAVTETYVTAHHHVRADAPPRAFMGGTGEPHDLVIGARYIDRLECRAGLWRIVERRSFGDWKRVRRIGS